jgi:putative nucleotidyltransferase with HDIG domain
MAGMGLFIAEQTLDLGGEGSVSIDTTRLLSFLEKKNRIVYDHSHQVANYATSTAAKMHLLPPDIYRIKIAALLHDIGKLAVSNAVLDKIPYLSNREMGEYKRHAAMGANMLETLPGFQAIIPLIRHHHERWDGKGFPKRLKGVNIPLGARIIGVADYYDSYVNPCRSKWRKNAQLGVKELLAHAGTIFDPEVVKAFVCALNKDACISLN